MQGLDELVGSAFGPFSLEVTAERVAAFVAATGDDPAKWLMTAPALFANAVLFAAAPALLDDERVKPFTTSLIHSEQSFAWARQLDVGERLAITGTVESVRARGSLSFVTFAIDARSEQGPWLRGSSVFLMSDQAAAAAPDAGEPAEDDRPPQALAGDIPVAVEVGDLLPVMECGASRSDLMRYAAASQDWNPIHFDHDAARAAGLGGVIVHGLLMASWIGRAANRYGNLDSMRLRFRNPLRPAVAALVSGSVKAASPDAVDLEMVLTADEQRLVTASVSVTP
jgi:acyl dehydratase